MKTRILSLAAAEASIPVERPVLTVRTTISTGRTAVSALSTSGVGGSSSDDADDPWPVARRGSGDHLPGDGRKIGVLDDDRAMGDHALHPLAADKVPVCGGNARGESGLGRLHKGCGSALCRTLCGNSGRLCDGSGQGGIIHLLPGYILVLPVLLHLGLDGDDLLLYDDDLLLRCT